VAALLAMLAVAFATQTSYNHYKLVAINVKNEAALNDLKSFLGPTADVWSNEGILLANVDNHVLLSPHQYESLLFRIANQRTAKIHEISSATVEKFELIHKNVQELIDASFGEAPVSEADDFFKKYQRYADIVTFTNKLHEAHPNITKIISIGESWEKRSLNALVLSEDPEGSTKKLFFFNGLQHAREWIAASTVPFIMRHFVEKYAAGDAVITELVKKYDVVFNPISNPDGYEYAHVKDRLWRKNRRDNGKNIFGVDLNRNWPIGYGIGASTSPSSIVYRGPSPLSEPESTGMNKYFVSVKGRLIAAIDFHSYSQLVLRPWGFNHTIVPEEEKFKALGAHMAAAIKASHNMKYDNIRGVELYPAGGGLDDGLYGLFRVASYTVELRDTGRHGFVLPPDQIIPTGEENLAAVIAFMKHFDD